MPVAQKFGILIRRQASKAKIFDPHVEKPNLKKSAFTWRPMFAVYADLFSIPFKFGFGFQFRDLKDKEYPGLFGSSSEPDHYSDGMLRTWQLSAEVVF